jgi:hypothetical protein
MVVGMPRWGRRRRERRASSGEAALTSLPEDKVTASEIAAILAVSHSEAGEMAAVAIEMLDLFRRWRRRG